MTEFYPWFVFLHLIGLVVFAFGHGVSMFAAFRARATPEPRAVRGALEASSMALGPMYIGLLLLAIGGIGAATIGGLWGQPWVWGSVVILIIVIVAMYAIATPYYRQVRTAVGAPAGNQPAGESTVTQEELVRLLDSRRPETLMAVGTIGLVALVWLMVLKPTF